MELLLQKTEKGWQARERTGRRKKRKWRPEKDRRDVAQRVEISLRQAHGALGRLLSAEFRENVGNGVSRDKRQQRRHYGSSIGPACETSLPTGQPKKCYHGSIFMPFSTNTRYATMLQSQVIGGTFDLSVVFPNRV